MTKTALILGPSGKIGAHSARAFAAAGWTVRTYKRGTDMARATQGADVIVNGLNPPNYHDWDNIIPAITKQVIAAAKASGATVIIPGNVYNFGDAPGTWDETTPHRPVARKGRIREDMERAYARSGVQTIILRAGNFIDPDRNGDILSMVLLRGLKRGKVTYPGDPAAMQAYAFLPDWAHAAVMLAEKRAELGPFEDVPLGGLAFTANDLAAHLQARLGRKIAVTGFPWWIMRLASPFWELARELRDMRYLWSVDHRLGTDRLTALLPDFRTTPFEKVIDAALPTDIRPDQPVPADARVAAS